MEKLKNNTKRQQVRYEFYTFQSDIILPNKQYNLKLENPTEIRFLVIAPYSTISAVTINNVYQLTNFNYSVHDITSTTPYELILKNNLDEIDITNYSINIFGPDTTVIVTCKYFVNV